MCILSGIREKGRHTMNDSDMTLSEISHFNENLIANIQGGVIICQVDPITSISKAVYISEGWTKLTGYTLEELNEECGGNPLSLVYPEDGPQSLRDYVEQTRSGNSYQLEYRCRHRDGRLIWVIDRGVITATAEGYNQNQSIVSDISPLKENEEKLRMSEARFRVALSASNAAVFEFDIDENRYIYIENAAVIFRADAQTVISAFDAAKAHSRDFKREDVFALWYHPDDVPTLLHSYEEVLRNGIGGCDVRLRLPGGGYIWCKLHQAVVGDKSGRPIRVVGHLIDIDEQHKQTERLLLEAQSDALTGLYNKAAIRGMTEGALKKAPQSSHAFFMLDIDNFKGVNDQLGHLFGDAVLMDVSAKLKRLFRRDGVVGRIGGDEFVVLLNSGCSEQSAAARAELICNAFRHTYSGEKQDYKISCSVGIALSTVGDSYDSLFRKADLALYRAKSMGKDRYSLYSEELSKTPALGTRVNQNDSIDSGGLKIKERIFELMYDSVDFGGSINMILALLGQNLDASRICIFENTEDGSVAELIYEWGAEGVPTMAEADRRLPVAEQDYFAQFDEAGLLHSGDFSELQQPIRETLLRSGAHTTFQVAIMEENTVKGFARYDSAHSDHVFTDDQIEIMTFAAKITGTFIIKRRADEGVKLFNQNKMEALDNLPSAIYVIDDQYRLHYANNMVINFYPEVKLLQKCHDVFMRNACACPNCPAAGDLRTPRSAEIYNPHSKMWMIANASRIRWSGHDNMRLICCQIISQYKTSPDDLPEVQAGSDVADS